ncbi:MAG: glycosyltransferase family 39 protein [Acidobacteria bacterium]|nr:glycosyltransferase family 39 protein [Acidobacteriota bacterium]
MTFLPAVVASRFRVFTVLVTGVLILAAFNLGFRLDREFVGEWDESLYATTAWEMHKTGEWIATTFHGVLDYYNSKPPLNAWLIVLSFKTLGVNLIALRLSAVVAAWLTIAVLVCWVWKHIGNTTAVMSGLVLATTFGLFYPHAGRSANTDAVFTLLVVLTVVALWSAQHRPWRLMWLGPILAAVFMLRGMGILMPLAIVTVYEVVTFGIRRRGRWVPTVAATMLLLLPVAAWTAARWRIDQAEFLKRVFWYDFVARSVSTIEDHPGSVFYYLNILQKHQYDWIAAAVLAWLLFPVAWAKVRELVRIRRGDETTRTLLIVWALVALGIPTLMRTKLAWYLHPFYPVFAIGVGAVLAQAWGRAAAQAGGWRSRRSVALAAVLVLALGVAEGKLIWYSYHHRDLASSTQGVLLSAQDDLRGRSVFRRRWDRAEMFVIQALIGAKYGLAVNEADFLRNSRPGDCLMSSKALHNPALLLLRHVGLHYLYKRTE